MDCHGGHKESAATIIPSRLAGLLLGLSEVRVGDARTDARHAGSGAPVRGRGHDRCEEVAPPDREGPADRDAGVLHALRLDAGLVVVRVEDAESLRIARRTLRILAGVPSEAKILLVPLTWGYIRLACAYRSLLVDWRYGTLVLQPKNARLTMSKL